MHFFFFLLLTEIDFLYSCIVSVLEFTGTLHGNGLYRVLFLTEPLKSYGYYVSIILACYSGFAFLLVSPLFYVQLVNIIKHTTTNERFGYNVFFYIEKKKRKKKRTSFY